MKGLLVERWNGSAWSLARVPLPAGTSQAVLSGVACIARDCTAVGSYHRAGGVFTLVERWSGGHWSVQSSPNAANASRQWGSMLVQVSCGSSTSCVALGEYGKPGEAGNSTAQTLVERWNGGRWTIVRVPVATVSRTVQSLAGVSCVAKMCVAVGEKASTNPAVEHGMPVAEIMRLGVWSVQSLPPDKQPAAGLNSVSCSSSTSCTAVGSSGTTLLVERWNGASWSLQNAPDPYPNSNPVSAVSCLAADECTAVGSSPGEVFKPLVAQWNGSSWAVQQAPAPPPAPANGTADGSQLVAVSCTPARTCMAVGYSITPTGTGHNIGGDIFRALAVSYTP